MFFFGRGRRPAGGSTPEPVHHLKKKQLKASSTSPDSELVTRGNWVSCFWAVVERISPACFPH